MSKRYFSIMAFVIAATILFVGSANACPAKKTFLWKVTSPRRVLYLAGVTQMLRSENYPLPKEVVQAFQRSGELVVEGNVDPGPQQKEKALSLLMKEGMLPSGKKLAGILNVEQQGQVKEAFSKLGFPFSRANSMRPWLAALVMMQLTKKKLGINPMDQEMLRFIKQAKERKMPVTPLESSSYQINMFSEMAQAQQISWLITVARELSVMSSARSKIITAWRDGDTKVIARWLENRFRGHPKLYQALVTRRNQRWLKVLDSRLSKGGKPVFVAVGAGHLVGPGNLVSALRKAGYKVTQL